LPGSLLTLTCHYSTMLPDIFGVFVLNYPPREISTAPLALFPTLFFVETYTFAPPFLVRITLAAFFHLPQSPLVVTPQWDNPAQVSPAVRPPSLTYKSRASVQQQCVCSGSVTAQQSAFSKLFFFLLCWFFAKVLLVILLPPPPSP